MGLTWRDAVTSVLAAAVVLIALAVTNEWGWPLLASYRFGSLAVGLVGFAMCITAGSGRAIESEMQDRGVRVLSAFGVLALVLMVAGVISGSELLFTALVIDILGMWLMATIRHAAAGFGAPRHAGHPAKA